MIDSCADYVFPARDEQYAIGDDALNVGRVLTEWLHHYAHGRPHRGLGQLAPTQAECGPPAPINLAEHLVRRRAIVGGLTHEYWTATAA